MKHPAHFSLCSPGNENAAVPAVVDAYFQLLELGAAGPSKSPRRSPVVLGPLWRQQHPLVQAGATCWAKPAAAKKLNAKVEERIHHLEDITVWRSRSAGAASCPSTRSHDELTATGPAVRVQRSSRIRRTSPCAAMACSCIRPARHPPAARCLRPTRKSEASVAGSARCRWSSSWRTTASTTLVEIPIVIARICRSLVDFFQPLDK